MIFGPATRSATATANDMQNADVSTTYLYLSLCAGRNGILPPRTIPAYAHVSAHSASNIASIPPSPPTLYFHTQLIMFVRLKTSLTSFINPSSNNPRADTPSRTIFSILKILLIAPKSRCKIHTTKESFLLGIPTLCLVPRAHIGSTRRQRRKIPALNVRAVSLV